MPTIARVASVVGSKTTLAILDNLLLETKNDKEGNTYLFITASDAETWLTMKLRVEASGESLRTCISANDFKKALSNLGDVDVVLTFKDNNVVCSYGVGDFTLPIFDAQDYPIASIDMDGASSFVVYGWRLQRALEKSSIATANDALRPIMNGVHFDLFKDSLIAVSSDGQRLVKYRDDKVEGEDETKSFNLPNKPSSIIVPIIAAEEEIKIAFNEKGCVISNSTFKLTTRLIEGRYPNYAAVIPQTCNFKVSINKESLSRALKRVLPMGSTTSELIKLKFTRGNLEVSAKDVDFAKSARENIPCDFDGEIFEIGFKGSSLISLLSPIEEETITLELTAKDRACVIYSDNKDEYLSLLMPMLLNN